MLKKLAERHLREVILPFWKKMKDETNGGYFGYMGFDLKVDEKAVKGCILHSRILWFFSEAARILKDKELVSYADHAYRFIHEKCLDKENGGIYWAMNYDGTVSDGTKHTYNQAFCIYALSAYYQLTGNEEALHEAFKLFSLIESRCRDEIGYLEAFTVDFRPESNEKLSENGVMAEKTMNTLLHVLEAYTKLYEVSHVAAVKDCLVRILNQFVKEVYQPKLHRQEVFFDRTMHSLIDLHSYGHDIESSWLMDRACDIIANDAVTAMVRPVSDDLRANIYQKAYREHSLLNECERGVDDCHRIWWVQAESVVGFLNGYEKQPEHLEYLGAALDIFHYDLTVLCDHREGSEWFWRLNPDHTPDTEKPMVEPWKCPYHNGRMCLEILTRTVDV